MTESLRCPHPDRRGWPAIISIKSPRRLQARTCPREAARSLTYGHTLAHHHQEKPMNTANTINTTRSLTRVIAGALLSGGIAAAGLGLASGTAEANIWIHWCPGDDPIGGVGVAYQIENWDYN